MDQPVTTNPIMIALINMTVVFAVLYGLSWIIRLIKVVDPTQKKNIAKVEQAAPAPAAAPVPSAPESVAARQDETEIVAVIAAALAAYGYGHAQIASVRPVSGGGWAQAARLDAVNARSQMY